MARAGWSAGSCASTSIGPQIRCLRFACRKRVLPRGSSPGGGVAGSAIGPRSNSRACDSAGAGLSLIRALIYLWSETVNKKIRRSSRCCAGASRAPPPCPSLRTRRHRVRAPRLECPTVVGVWQTHVPLQGVPATAPRALLRVDSKGRRQDRYRAPPPRPGGSLPGVERQHAPTRPDRAGATGRRAGGRYRRASGLKPRQCHLPDASMPKLGCQRASLSRCEPEAVRVARFSTVINGQGGLLLRLSGESGRGDSGTR